MQGEKPIDGEKVWKWEWSLTAPPEKLWPLVSDTQRVGKAIGFGPWNFKERPDPRGGSIRTGTVTALGIDIEWEEHPYEWVAPREMAVVRTYTKGPFAVIRQHVALAPEGSGSRLIHLIAVRSTGIVGSLSAAYEVGVKTRSALDRVYRGFDQHLAGHAPTSFPPDTIVLADGAAEVLKRTHSRLLELGFEVPLVARLAELISRESDRDVNRMRPFVVARRWETDRFLVLRLFLHATKLGLLEMSWDLICPSCKGAKESTGDLADLKTEVHCESCNIKFDAQFDESVEVTFRPSAAVRPIHVGEFCVGGPGNTRHLLVQQRVPSGQTTSVHVHLEPGLYRLRGPRKPGETIVTVEEGAPAELPLEVGKFPEKAFLAPAGQLRVTNGADFEHTVQLERLAWKEDVASGTVVTCLQEFRDLFSSAVFSPGVKIGISSIAILFTDLKASTAMYEKVGDAAAFALVRDHFKLLFETISGEQGGLVKTIGDAVMASFPRAENAFRAALHMHAQIASFNEHEKPAFPVRLKIGIHSGPCIAVNMNERLDYFGTTVNVAARIQNESVGDDIVLLESVAQDREVAKAIDAASGTREVFETELKGLTGKFRLVRFVPARGFVPHAGLQRSSTRFKQTNLFG